MCKVHQIKNIKKGLVLVQAVDKEGYQVNNFQRERAKCTLKDKQDFIKQRRRVRALWTPEMCEQSLKIKIHAIFKKLAEDKYSQNTRDEVIRKKSKEDGITIDLYGMLKKLAFFLYNGKPSEVFKQEKYMIKQVFSVSRQYAG